MSAARTFVQRPARYIFQAGDSSLVRFAPMETRGISSRALIRDLSESGSQPHASDHGAAAHAARGRRSAQSRIPDPRPRSDRVLRDRDARRATHGVGS